MADDRDEEREKEGVAYESMLEQPDVNDCQAKPSELSLGPEALSAQAHETKWPVQAELDEAFTAEALATPMARDGLPDHSQDVFDGGTHPFSIDHVVCIEDNRGLVAIMEGELAEHMFQVRPLYSEPCRALAYIDAAAGVASLDARGAARVYVFRERAVVISFQRRTDNEGRPVARESLAGPEVKLWEFDAAAGLGIAPIGTLAKLAVKTIEERLATAARTRGWAVPPLDETVYAACRFRRLRCSYYKRQMFAVDEQKDPTKPGHRVVFRNCTHPARRSVGGASLGLDNEAVYACDYREPRDPASEQLIDAFDLTKMRDRPDLIRVPLFGMPGDDVDLRDKEEK